MTLVSVDEYPFHKLPLMGHERILELALTKCAGCLLLIFSGHPRAFAKRSNFSTKSTAKFRTPGLGGETHILVASRDNRI